VAVVAGAGLAQLRAQAAQAAVVTAAQAVGTIVERQLQLILAAVVAVEVIKMQQAHLAVMAVLVL
jgi:hypothetical protein